MNGAINPEVANSPLTAALVQKFYRKSTILDKEELEQEINAKAAAKLARR